MDYLLISGIRLRVTLAVSIASVLTRKVFSSILGENRPQHSSDLDSISLSTVPLGQQEANAVSGLLRGIGNYFSFAVHSWGSAGMQPTAGGLGTMTIVPNGYFSGINSIQLPTGTIGWYDVVFSKAYKKQWTICFLYKELAGTWAHVAFRSDGVKFLNGVVATPPVVTVNSNPSAIFILGNPNCQLASVVYVPYIMPDAWVAAIFNDVTVGHNHFSPLPKLLIKGDVLINGVRVRVPYKALAEVTGEHSLNLTGDASARVINFQIQQVPK